MQVVPVPFVQITSLIFLSSSQLIPFVVFVFLLVPVLLIRNTTFFCFSLVPINLCISLSICLGLSQMRFLSFCMYHIYVLRICFPLFNTVYLIICQNVMIILFFSSRSYYGCNVYGLYEFYLN